MAIDKVLGKPIELTPGVVAVAADDRSSFTKARHLTPPARDRLLAPSDEKAAGAHKIVPLRLVFAVAVKDLHAMIFAIGDVDPTLIIAGDIVDEIELPRIGTRLAPGQQESGEYL